MYQTVSENGLVFHTSHLWQLVSQSDAGGCKSVPVENDLEILPPAFNPDRF
ncbi:hypothetical protein [Ruminococcus sp.]|uniref:hypothetical protein n=1 Tax=Ruminococcus sp. TaxID=41978 RepID=UPI003A914CC8